MDTHKVHIGIETSPGLMPGCYIQGSNGIEIGDYTQIAAGVKIISANHLLTDIRAHLKTRPIRIGKYCWLGANSVILPGVELGTYTIVGAGAIVTKSFPEGYCVIAGNPARIIKDLNPAECIFHESDYKYNGFIRSDRFEEFRTKFLTPLEA
ncbi:acyltransferase [Roseateles sp.]|uniref:acyltransferase n=1 Tax=Roseateles sp. TaxID=1971397 RepID=UPI002E178B25